MDNTQYTQLARKIPSAVRDQRILVPSNPIGNAIGVGTDKHMHMLASIWFKFIEPHAAKDFECPKCMSNILQNFRELRPTLIALQREEKLLKML